jgi:nitrate reductase cytochrome c-type subunit
MAIRPDRFRSGQTFARSLLSAAIAAALSAWVFSPAALANQRDEQAGAYQQWEKMPPQQRDRILQEQQRFKRLPPGEQERLRREYEQQHRQ